jgi:hypothetical protein
MTHATPNARSPAADPQPEVQVARSRNTTARVATWLTWLVAALALAAALSGLIVDSLYTGDVSTAEMFRGYDLVTAVVVVPSLALALLISRFGSVRAQLATSGLVAYLVYTYAYYLFGTGFNDLFLLHVAVFATALWALVLTLVAIDVTSVAERFSPSGPVRAVAGILGALSVGLGGMWMYFAVNNAVTGNVPAGSQLVETDTIVHPGMALDLSVLVPLYAVAAVLLWRRAAWGYMLAAVALVAGILHQVSYVAAMPFQFTAHVPGAVSYDPIEFVIVLLYLVATALLVRGMSGTPREGARR